MKLADAKVLLYAVDEKSKHHAAALNWLDSALSGSDTVGFAWVVLLAFLRLSTRPDIFARPLTVDESLDLIDAWMSTPASVVVGPGPHHTQALRGLLTQESTAANLVNDAHLAALALERHAEVITFDRDFGRFTSVRSSAPPAA